MHVRALLNKFNMSWLNKNITFFFFTFTDRNNEVYFLFPIVKPTLPLLDGFAHALCSYFIA